MKDIDQLLFELTKCESYARNIEYREPANEKVESPLRLRRGC